MFVTLPNYEKLNFWDTVTEQIDHLRLISTVHCSHCTIGAVAGQLAAVQHVASLIAAQNSSLFDPQLVVSGLSERVRVNTTKTQEKIVM